MPVLKTYSRSAVMLFSCLTMTALAVDFEVPEYESVMPGLDFGEVQLQKPALVYYVVRAELGKEDYRVGSINAGLNEIRICSRWAGPAFDHAADNEDAGVSGQCIQMDKSYCR